VLRDQRFEVQVFALPAGQTKAVRLEVAQRGDRRTLVHLASIETRRADFQHCEHAYCPPPGRPDCRPCATSTASPRANRRSGTERARPARAAAPPFPACDIPGLSGSGRAHGRRWRARAGDDATGNTRPEATRRASDHQHSQHPKPALTAMARAGSPVLGASDAPSANIRTPSRGRHRHDWR